MFEKKDGNIYSIFETENSRIEILVNQFHIQLETDKTSILANGTDTATIKAKVFNYENNYQVNFADDIYFRVAEEMLVVKAVNGQAQIELQSDIQGSILVEVSAVGIEGAVVQIESK